MYKSMIKCVKYVFKTYWQNITVQMHTRSNGNESKSLDLHSNSEKFKLGKLETKHLSYFYTSPASAGNLNCTMT